MTPRPARPEEAAALRDLVRAAYAPWVPVIGREPGPMNDDFAARIAAGQAWVVDAGDALVGALVIEDSPTGLLIDNVAVAAAAQGTGLGRALMAFAEAEAARRGHRRVWLYTHEKMVRNIALYARLGFVETHRAEQSGFQRVFMAKTVAPGPKPQRKPALDRPRPPLLHRLALTMIGPQRRGPAGSVLALLGMSALIFTSVGALMGRGAWQDWRMMKSWPHAEGIVISIGAESRVKGTHYFPLLLRVPAPDGRTFEGWTFRAHPVARRLEAPNPHVAPGERLTVVMDPQDPARFTTLASLRHVSGLIVALIFGLAGGVTCVAGMAALKARRILR